MDNIEVKSATHTSRSSAPQWFSEEEAIAQRVLIVDDEKTIRTAVEMIIGKKYDVIKADSGDQAMDLFRTEAPDLVLLDIGLPDMDGMEALREMKREDPDAAVVMVTAVEEIKTVLKAVKLGACDYLVKPFTARELHLTVDNALERIILLEDGDALTRKHFFFLKTVDHDR